MASVTFINGARQAAKTFAKELRNVGVPKEGINKTVPGVGTLTARPSEQYVAGKGLVKGNFIEVNRGGHDGPQTIYDSFLMTGSGVKHTYSQVINRSTTKVESLSLAPQRGRFWGLGKRRDQIHFESTDLVGKIESKLGLNASGPLANPRNIIAQEKDGNIFMPAVEKVKEMFGKIFKGEFVRDFLRY